MNSTKRTRPGIFVCAAVSVLIAGTGLAGSISGTVSYDGKVPNLRAIKMDADPGCAAKHKEAPKSEVLVLGEGQTMGNVLVRVRSGASGGSAPSTPVVLDQDGCQYKPHVLGVMAGQPLKILNSDGLLHNVHALPKVNQGFNQAMPGSVKEATKTFDKVEPPFKIKCDVHPWMGAWVVVMDNPHFAVTGPDGKYSLDGLPAGEYEIEAWHEKLKTRTAKVTITGDGAAMADIVFSPPQR